MEIATEERAGEWTSIDIKSAIKKYKFLFVVISGSYFIMATNENPGTAPPLPLTYPHILMHVL